MNTALVKADTVKYTSKPGRRVFTALLLAVILAVLAGSALAAALVKNGSFEKDSNGDGLPNNWEGSSLTLADKRVCNQSYAGSCSFKMVGDGTEKQLSQFISISGFEGDQFTFKVWTKGKNIVNGIGAAAVSVQIYYTDGDPPYDYWFFPTPAGTTPWTLHQLTATADRTYDAIAIIFQMYPAVTGKIWFDKVKLVGP
jgi:hypothetical protein